MTTEHSYARQVQRDGKVPLATKIIQGVGAIPDTFKNFAFNTFLLFFYNQVLGMPAFLASVALGIAMVFDGITDPVVGSISDNMKTRLGRRHPLMYVSALPLGLTLYLTFVPPSGLSDMGLFAWLTFFAIAVRGSMTLFLVPWSALQAELSEDYAERSTIVTFRFLFGWIGGTVFTWCTWTYIFPSSEAYTPGHLNPEGYPVFALALGLLVFASVVLTTHFSRREIPYLVQPTHEPPRFSPTRVLRELWEALQNRQFLILFVAVLTGAAIAGTGQALEIYMNTYFWGFTPEDLRWFAIVFLGAVAAFASVSWVQERIDKKHIIIGVFLFQLLDGITLINLRFLDVLPENGTTLLLVLMVGNHLVRVYVGTISAIMGASMVADILDYQELRTGKRQEGMFFSALSFSGKATSGLGVVFGGLVLELLAFPAGLRPTELDPGLIVNLGIVAGIVIPLFYLIPFGLFGFYKITRTEHARIRAELAQRRAAAESESSFEAGPLAQ